MAQKIYEIDYPETNLEDFLIEDDGANPVYVLPIGTILYRGDSQINNPLKNLKGINWYGVKLKDIIQYGHPKKYRTNKELILLAIDKVTEEHPIYEKFKEKDKLQLFNKFFLFSDVVGRTRSSIPKNDANMTKFLNEQGYTGYGMQEMHKDDWEIAESLFHSEIAMINGDDNLIDVENVDVENIVYQNGERIKNKDGSLVTKETIKNTIQSNKESKALRKSQREAQEKKRKAKRRDYDEDEENNTSSSSSFVASDIFRSPVMSSSPVGRFNNLTIGSPNRTPTARTPITRTPRRSPIYSPSAYQSPSNLMQGYESTKSTPSPFKKPRKLAFNGGKKNKTKRMVKSKSRYTKKRNMKKTKKNK